MAPSLAWSGDEPSQRSANVVPGNLDPRDAAARKTLTQQEMKEEEYERNEAAEEEVAALPRLANKTVALK